MSMDFVECIVSRDCNKQQVESIYVVGRVLPIRWANVKQVETIVGSQLTESNELTSFTYGQFIQLDCIKTFYDVKKYIVEYGP
jgi:hypothetical protein